MKSSPRRWSAIYSPRSVAFSGEARRAARPPELCFELVRSGQVRVGLDWAGAAARAWPSCSRRAGTDWEGASEMESYGCLVSAREMGIPTLASLSHCSRELRKTPSHSHLLAPSQSVPVARGPRQRQRQRQRHTLWGRQPALLACQPGCLCAASQARGHAAQNCCFEFSSRSTESFFQVVSQDSIQSDRLLAGFSEWRRRDA